MQIDIEKLQPPEKGRAIADLEISVRDRRRLEEIHSETTEGERCLIHNFLARVWDGNGDVLEVGTYLGGTTRCLGIGLVNNPYSTARLISCDMFQGYHKPARLLQETKALWEPLQNALEVKAELEAGRWRKLFEQLHLSQDYGKRLSIFEGKLPDQQEDPFPDSIAGAIDSSTQFGIVFVDGCKSWWSTKQLMLRSVPKLPPGGWLIFQDFGRHTCIWISAFVSWFQNHLTPYATISGTYIFRYKGGLTPAKIAEFPDDPEKLDEQNIADLMHPLYRLAVRTNDLRAAYTFTVQHAALLAYSGKVRAGRAMLSHVDIPAFDLFVDTTESAMLTPTFSPTQPIYLVKPR